MCGYIISPCELINWIMSQEVRKIKNAHPDDPSAIMNDRVKGYLKVTRAFGAGFLKKVP